MIFEVGERVYFADPKLNLLISYDKPPLPGWVVMGRHGEDCIMIDHNEWDDFVKLILDAAKYISANRLDDDSLKDILDAAKYLSTNRSDAATLSD